MTDHCALIKADTDDLGQQVYPILTLLYTKYLHLDEIRGPAQMRLWLPTI